MHLTALARHTQNDEGESMYYAIFAFVCLKGTEGMRPGC